MKPRVDILPAEQRRLWTELSQIPPNFVLYGGTAIALRFGNRQSIDFDFFSEVPVSADAVLRDIPLLAGAQLLQAESNTATFSVEREGAVKVSFFGGLTFGRVGIPDRCEDNGIYVASPLDLAAHKMKVILSRAEAKDYLDIFALLKAGITLPEALGAAKALYPELNPMLSLKALAYFGEPSLHAVPQNIKETLIRESSGVDSVHSAEKRAPTISLAPGAAARD